MSRLYRHLAPEPLAIFISVRGLEDGNKSLHQQTIFTPLRQLRREPTSRLPGTTKLGSIIEGDKLIARLKTFNFDIGHLHFSGRAFGSAAAVGAAGPAAAAPLAASARNKETERGKLALAAVPSSHELTAR